MGGGALGGLTPLSGLGLHECPKKDDPRAEEAEVDARIYSALTLV